MLKKTLSVTLIIVLLFSVFTVIPMTAYAEISGECGKNAFYTISDDGVLTIYGTGDMSNFSNATSTPWYKARDSITRVIIEDGITSIGSRSFYGFDSIKSISIPDSITSIGQYALYGCNGLIDIHLGNGVKQIGNNSFSQCKNLESINIPDGVTNIGGSTFSGCSCLRSLSIPDSVTNIGLNAFENCKGLLDFEFGNNVSEVTAYMFYECSSLKRLVIPDSVTKIGYHAFQECKELSEIIISKNVESIGVHSFYGCSSLKSIIIPDGVKSLGNYMFYNCSSLGSVVFSKSVTQIGSYAFQNCDNLSDVYYSGNQLDWSCISISNLGNSDLLSADIHYDYQYSDDTVIHTIISDNGDHRGFSFNVNEEIEDLVGLTPSTKYNPRLSHFLSCMARSAYTMDLVKDNYLELGFNKISQEHYSESDPLAAFTIGEKELNDENKLVMITIKGTNNKNEWLETNFNLGNSTMLLSVGLHSGFLASADEVFNSLKSYMSGSIKKQNVTYVITGHSLGAAAGNILAAKLDADGVPNQNVYDYNYACPNVGMGSNDISVWNNNGKHNNIINVGNWCDIVTHEPGFNIESVSVANRTISIINGWKKWKRYGVSYWFDNGWQFLISHDMGVYLDYLEKENDETHFTQKEYEVKAISAHCPVDVVVYDSKGNPIAGTINNEPNYFGYEPGEKALIFIDGDRKLFHVFNNEAYEVKLVGTDEGEMEYGVSTGDMTSGDVYTEKWFEAVPLTDGMEMLGKAVNVLDEDTKTITQDEKLLLVDDQGRMNTQILENGEETVYSVKYILGDSDDSGKIDAVDATAIQRKLAMIQTPFADDILLQGDANGNGDLEITDVTAIQSYLAQFNTPYLIGADVV